MVPRPSILPSCWSNCSSIGALVLGLTVGAGCWAPAGEKAASTNKSEIAHVMWQTWAESFLMSRLLSEERPKSGDERQVFPDK
jgi:hypothetical protein